MNLRDKILNAYDIEHRLVDVPEWGVKVELRTPSVRQRGELIASFMGADGELDYVKMYPSLVIATAFDPKTGEPIFTPDDFEALTTKSGKAMETLGSVAVEIAGLDQAAKRVAEGKDDSSPTLSTGTSSF